jgi:hypothetical protein
MSAVEFDFVVFIINRVVHKKTANQRGSAVPIDYLVALRGIESLTS